MRSAAGTLQKRSVRILSEQLSGLSATVDRSRGASTTRPPERFCGTRPARRPGRRHGLIMKHPKKERLRNRIGRVMNSRRNFYTEYVPFWSVEYGVFHGIRGIRVEYGQNTVLCGVVWNTLNTYSQSRVMMCLDVCMCRPLGESVFGSARPASTCPHATTWWPYRPCESAYRTCLPRLPSTLLPHAEPRASLYTSFLMSVQSKPISASATEQITRPACE